MYANWVHKNCGLHDILCEPIINVPVFSCIEQNIQMIFAFLNQLGTDSQIIDNVNEILLS